MSELQEGIAAQEGGVSARSGAGFPLPRFLRFLLTHTVSAGREQAHQQLKEELGLDHFERRSWQGLIAYAVLQYRGLPRSRQSNRSMQFAMLRDNTTVLPN
jgi:hypothetical protein